jgi:outer membrane protein assembly factor BamB
MTNFLSRATSFSSLFFLLSMTPLQTQAWEKLELAHKLPEVKEVFMFAPPGKKNSPSIEATEVMPQQRSSAQFKGTTGVLASKSPRPWCGPSPETNTINCFNFNEEKNRYQSFPFPGKLSATPFYYDRSWLFGSSKGFLVRVSANTNNGNMPSLEKDNQNLWGNHSRDVMFQFRPKTIYSEDNNETQNSLLNSNTSKLTYGIKWVFSGASPFIGTPVVKNGLIYILSSSQYFQAFNWDTGKLVWAVRLAPSSKLRLNTDAFEYTPNAIYAGNSLGTLIALNPTNGAELWSWQVPSATSEQRLQTKLPAGPDRFTGIVAPPLVLNHSLVVSNAESMTQSISLDNHSLLWSYPSGSVAKPRQFQSNILIGTIDGHIVSLDKETGKENWNTKVTQGTPVMSLFLTKNKLLLATNHNGQISLLNPETGKMMSSSDPKGDIVGEFEPGYGKADACLSFLSNRFRCFRVAQ